VSAGDDGRVDLDSVTLRSRFGRWVPALGLAARLVLAGVLGVSGVIKAADPLGTKVAVRAYSLFPDGWVDPVAIALPYLEIALGLLMLVGLAVRLTAVLAGLLFLGFIVGVISAAARGLSIDCGCFGGGGEVAPGETRYTAEIVRDVVFLALAVWLVVKPRTLWSVDGLVGRERADTEHPES
jgi:uncharacterized membrane protein YphA (DoxX/SURF4 family)